MACLDGDLVQSCPNSGAKCRHWYVGLVVPGGYTYQALPRSNAIPEAATRGVSLKEAWVLYEVEDSLLAQVEPVPFVAYAPVVQILQLVADEFWALEPVVWVSVGYGQAIIRGPSRRHPQPRWCWHHWPMMRSYYTSSKSQGQPWKRPGRVRMQPPQRPWCRWQGLSHVAKWKAWRGLPHRWACPPWRVGQMSSHAWLW